MLLLAIGSDLQPWMALGRFQSYMLQEAEMRGFWWCFLSQRPFPIPILLYPLSHWSTCWNWNYPDLTSWLSTHLCTYPFLRDGVSPQISPLSPYPLLQTFIGFSHFVLGERKTLPNLKEGFIYQCIFPQISFYFLSTFSNK